MSAIGILALRDVNAAMLILRGGRGWQARRKRHATEHVTARQLLSQRTDGKLFLEPERRVRSDAQTGRIAGFG